ncbi:helix-turn-helix domain-containing protein [Metapseudomonas boanensis]
MPAARVEGLRETGHLITAQRLTQQDESGRAHHDVALYCLGRPCPI